jgi:hypothetical protein
MMPGAMIIRPHDAGLTCITQPDHAQMAGRVMSACPMLPAGRRDLILLAVAEHDNGWAEEDAAPLLDSSSGEIRDFLTVPAEVKQRVWPRAVHRLRDTPWAAALVAHHAVTAYDRLRPDPAWTVFFPAMEALRDQMQGLTGWSAETLRADYAFLRMGDLISLAFCTEADGSHAFDRWTIHRRGTRVVVTPDLFGGATVPFEVTARRLSRRTFADGADARQAMAAAEVVTLAGEVVPA